MYVSTFMYVTTHLQMECTMRALLAFVFIVTFTKSETAIAQRIDYESIAPLVAPHISESVASRKAHLLKWCLMFPQTCKLTGDYADFYIQNKSRRFDSFVWSFTEQCSLHDDEVNAYMQKHVRWNSVWSLNKQCARANNKIEGYILHHVRHYSIWSCKPSSDYSRAHTRPGPPPKYWIFAEGGKIERALAAKLIVADDMRPVVKITEHDKNLCVSEHDSDAFFDVLNDKIEAAEAKAAEKVQLATKTFYHAILENLRPPTLA